MCVWPISIHYCDLESGQGLYAEVGSFDSWKRKAPAAETERMLLGLRLGGTGVKSDNSRPKAIW